MSQKPPSVFVVDDEKVISATLTKILQQNGFLATGFTDPVEALAAVRAEAPELLISDVMMPHITGIELAIRIRSEFPKCKILLLSGQGGTVDLLEKARSAGHEFTLLTKPLHPTELLAQIRAQDLLGSSGNNSGETSGAGSSI